MVWPKINTQALVKDYHKNNFAILVPSLFPKIPKEPFPFLGRSNDGIKPLDDLVALLFLGVYFDDHLQSTHGSSPFTLCP